MAFTSLEKHDKDKQLDPYPLQRSLFLERYLEIRNNTHTNIVMSSPDYSVQE
jgi:hypothetical protein